MRTTKAQISQCICAADQCLCNSLPGKNGGSKCYLEISIFWLVSVAGQTGLGLIWLETMKTGFLASKASSSLEHLNIPRVGIIISHPFRVERHIAFSYWHLSICLSFCLSQNHFCSLT